MLKRLPSALVSAGVTQLNTLVDKAMASMLQAGAISGLNYGHKLMNVFSGLLSSAIATAMYPQMIELISLNKKEELGKLIVKIINIFCVMMVPITFACILFRTEFVSAAFQRGAFDANSTLLTANVFALYSIGLFFIACNTVISNIFYGYGDTKTAMYISVMYLVINILLNIVFIYLWGINGLALATSLSAIITFFVRLEMIKKYVRLKRKPMMVTGVKVSAAAGIACMIPRGIFWFYPANNYLIITVSAIIGAFAYLFLAKIIFHVSEIDELMLFLRRKLKRNE